MGNNCFNGKKKIAIRSSEKPFDMMPPPPPQSVKIEQREIKPSQNPIKVHPAIKKAKINSQNPKMEQMIKIVKEKCKKQMSVGLKVDSVVRTKTGHLNEHFNLGDKLGSGQYGTTFLCVERKTGKKYACKSIAKEKLLSKGDVKDLRREIETMHHLSGHPNVVSIEGAYEDDVAVHVVMELCEGGELLDRILKRGHYSEKKVAELTRTIFGVIETCHSLGVMHRDLKPDNFLFVNEDGDSPLKIIDFGLAAFFKPGEIFKDVVGSPYYVAPEVLCKSYGAEADVWSAGVVVYILLCGLPPFWGQSKDEIFEAVLHGDIDFLTDPWPSISSSAKDLVKKMLVRDPRQRITAHQVLCHPWVQIDGVAPGKPLVSAVVSRLMQFSATGTLKKMARRVIAESLSEEEIAGLQNMFKTIDTNNNGYITFEELKAGVNRFGATNLYESEIHDLMKAVDVDSNGKIDYGEFIAATLHSNKIEKDFRLFNAFSYFDIDGNGYITRDELQRACEEFRIEDSHVEEMILEADQNNDGRIDYNEFVDMMHKQNTNEEILE